MNPPTLLRREPLTLEGMSVEPVSGAAGTALMGDISTLMSQLRAEGTGGLNKP